MKYLLVISALAVSVLVARGELFAFSAITSNDSNGHAQATGESQLHMDVSSLGTGQASLVFSNTGPEASVISSIYFDFVPELNLSLVAINDGDGVDFQTCRVRPRNLPAGQGLDHVFISDLGVAAGNPKPCKGINPYESLELIMSYDASYNLFGALGNEDLRVGLHVQGFAGGYSESFISIHTGEETVPEPGTLSILLVGGFVLRWLRRIR